MFAAAVCAVCSIFVAVSAVSLKDRQDLNKRVDVQQKVLVLADLMDEDEDLEPELVLQRFADSVMPRVVDMSTGSYAEEIDAATFDQKIAAKDPERSRPAPPNPSKVQRIPEHGLVYEVQKEGKLAAVILPIEGYGLWGTLYGYLSLAPDAETIQGIVFYDHKETPGLGGEVENPRWVALWPGRKAFDPDGKVAIRLKKGAAGPAESDPYRVDGLSGATITSRGVTNMLAFWLGDDGFGPFLDQFRAARSI
jgi:Na+-transporting NADH:ubiquinone oxidoreductase subunit C